MAYVLRRVPWGTIALVAASVLFFYLALPPLREWLESDPTGKMVSLLIHPLIHENEDHLWGNIFFGLLIAGTLIESWMTHLTQRSRWSILLTCYVISLTVSLGDWIVTGRIGVGTSDLAFAGLAFCLIYYRRNLDRIHREHSCWLVPVAMGVSLSFLLQPFVFGWSKTATLHLITFGLSLYVASLLLQRLR